MTKTDFLKIITDISLGRMNMPKTDVHHSMPLLAKIAGKALRKETKKHHLGLPRRIPVQRPRLLGPAAWVHPATVARCRAYEQRLLQNALNEWKAASVTAEKLVQDLCGPSV